MILVVLVGMRREIANFLRVARSVLLSVAIVVSVAGCVSDRQSQEKTPIDLVGNLPVQTVPHDAGPANLGVLLPLTGPHAEIAQELWDAATLALFDSGRDDIALVSFDTKGTALGTSSATQEAVATGSSAVVGPLFSASVASARPILAAAGLNGIAFSNNRAEARPPVFLIGNHPETQVDALVAYLRAAGRHRIKLLGPDTRYLQLIHERLLLLDKAGKIQFIDSRLYKNSSSYTEIAQDVRAITLYDRRVRALEDFTAIFAKAWDKFDDAEEAMRSAMETLAGRMEQSRLHFASLTSPAAVPPQLPERRRWAVTEDDYREALSDLVQTYHRQLKLVDTPRDAMREAIAELERRETLGKVDFDAILLPVGDRPLLVIAPMFAYFNATAPDLWIVGTDIWESTALQAPKDLRGGRYVTTSGPAWQDFQSRFKTTFGYMPSPIAATAYDAIRVAAKEKEETGRLSLDTAFLTRSAGFDGINGPFHFVATGGNERTLQVVEVGETTTSIVFTWVPEEEVAGPQPVLTGGKEKISPVPAESPAGKTVPPISALFDRGKERS